MPTHWKTCHQTHRWASVIPDGPANVLQRPLLYLITVCETFSGPLVLARLSDRCLCKHHDASFYLKQLGAAKWTAAEHIHL